MEASNTKNKYIETVGRRKTAIARVRITNAGKNSFQVNGMTLEEFFKTNEQRKIAMEAFTVSGLSQKFIVTVVVKGGGMNSQAEALRHGLSRGLVEFESTTRKALKSAKFLKRDPRSKERRKFVLKKARKAPQWSKR